MSTRLRLEKQLLRRVAELKNVKIVSDAGYAVYASNQAGESPPELLAEVQEVANRYRSAGWGARVLPFKSLAPEHYDESGLDSEKTAIATLGKVTVDGVIDSILKLFPQITHLQFVDNPGKVTLLVAYENGAIVEAQNELLKSTVRELVVPGLQIEIADFRPGSKNIVEGYWRGHLKPRTSSDLILKSDREQKDKFIGMAPSLVSNPERFELPFKLKVHSSVPKKWPYEFRSRNSGYAPRDDLIGDLDFRMFHMRTSPNSSSLAFRSRSFGRRPSRNRWYTCQALAPVSVVSHCLARSRNISRSSFRPFYSSLSRKETTLVTMPSPALLRPRA